MIARQPSQDVTTDTEFLQRVKDAVEPTTGATGSTETAVPPHHPPEPLPVRIGRYHIKRLIAAGGMGVVYEALQEHPRRPVALKVMRRGVTSPIALRRFEGESQLLGRLRHPSIAQVYDAGTHHDLSGALPYFAMEYIPNARTITEYVREKKLPTRRKLELFLHVCDAVHHGHQRGIIHRDLKPGNILVDASGQVKIIDFGVARATDADVVATTLQTHVGELIGTIKYMSPEQCLGDPNDIDVRSDVYALGVVLYEMLTGRLPYDLDNTPVLKAPTVIRETPPLHLSKLDRTLRGDIETIVETALEKDRGRRFQSVLAMKDDIERYLRSEPIQVRPAGTLYRLGRFVRRRRAPLAIAAVLCILAGFSGASYFRAREAEMRAAAAEVRKTAVARAAQQALQIGAYVQHELLNPSRYFRKDAEGLHNAMKHCTVLLQDLPDAAWLHAVRARLHLIAGNMSQARADNSRALRLDPNDGLALRNQGRLSAAEGRFGEALSHYEKGMERPGPIPNRAEDYHNRARLYRLKQHFEAALRDHDMAVRLAPGEELIYISRGITRRMAGDFHGAIEDFVKAGAQDDRLADQRHLWTWEIHILRQPHPDIQAAERALIAAAKATADDAFDTMLVQACRGRVRAGDLLDNASNPEKRCVAYYYLAVTALANGQVEEAEARFEKCIETGVHSQAEYDLATWHLQRLRRN